LHFSFISITERDIELDAAIKELNLAALDMEKLAENVDNFANWWSGVEEALSQTVMSASGLRPGKSKLRIQGIQRVWTTIRDDCKQYKD
jgi:hypothetical protein